MQDDDLTRFAEFGVAPLPDSLVEYSIDHDGAQIWYAVCGAGFPVILLHGGMGHSGNWGYQVPSLIDAGYQVILVDSRGHGRSTRDDRPYTYELMASDVCAVMDSLALPRVSVAGWSDGACIGMILGATVPERIAGVFFFGCNMDPSGTKPMTDLGPVVDRCFRRHVMDYKRLSPTPDQFEHFAAAVGQMMETQPNYTSDDLARIQVPVEIVQAENDEFIKREHAEYLARTIPNAHLTILPEVSHFAPWQRPDLFNQVLIEFLKTIHATPG